MNSSNTIIINGKLVNYGFCIKKILINKEIQLLLYNYFTVIPKLQYNDNSKNSNNDDKSFEVYYEDDKYLVLPKFMAGMKIKLSTTNNTNIKYIQFKITKISYKHFPININFKGNLRDYQLEIINCILTKFNINNELDKSNNLPTGGIISLSCGGGKCLAKNTEILMFDGTVKLVQNIIINDLLMGDDSTPRKVLSLARGKETMYRVNTNNLNGLNSSYTVNESHILSLKYKNNIDIIDISIKDYLNLPSTENLFGFRVPICFPTKDVEIDPYFFGYWLGKSCQININNIYIKKATIIKYIVDSFKKTYKSEYLNYTHVKNYYEINSINNNNIFHNFLKKYNILEHKHKHIPIHYKCNSRQIQLQLLAGIIDAIGYNKNNYYKIIQNNKILLDDIIFLARSLGFNVFINTHDKILNNYSISIYGNMLKEIPVLYPIKKILNSSHIKNSLNYKIKLEKLPLDDYYGFEIDRNRRFVLADFTVTHNTVLAIYLAHILKLKTLIIVHQEFLQDQWIERFKMFTNASIGSIRQDIIDTNGKDVVIGMLQSISSRDYDDNIFKEFGLVIYDETHHLGSKVFSRALLKTSAKYTIGLSATPERSDGMMKIVNWFIGDILYKMDKKYNYRILVKKIYFRSNDPLFKEKRRWLQGGIRPDNVKMTSNLTQIKSRNNLMINIIHTLKSMNRKIFVLSSRVEHLQTLKNGIDMLIKEANEEHIYNTYYYMGKSKKGERKLAEKDGDIIFATIQLAEEGLDISRLDTILIALPVKKEKTLLQSIGRILRNDKLEVLTQIPLVIDISDILSIYQKWSEKRDLVYNKKNWYIQNFYWEDNNFIYKNNNNLTLKPMNLMFDDILDEDFIDKNLIITNQNSTNENNENNENDDIIDSIDSE